MNPLGSRARAEELARLLEDSSSTAGGELALRLRAIAPALEAQSPPRAEFKAALRTRLLAVAEVQSLNASPTAEAAGPLAAVATWTQTRKAQRRIGATAGAMAGLIAFTGVGMAATRSLPGEPFYALKLSAEDIELRLTDGDQAKGSKHLEFADTRLREVEALTNGRDELFAGGSAAQAAARLSFGGPAQEKINRTLVEFDEQTRAGRMLLEGVFRQTGKPEPLRILKSFASDQQSRFAALLPSLPASSIAVAQRSLALVEELESTTAEQLDIGTCSGACLPTNQGPDLPVEPAPLPGPTASPVAPSDNNGVPDCQCRSTAEPTPEPTETPAPEPTSTPSSSPSPTPSPSPSPTPSPTTSPRPQPLPVPLPTNLPTPTPLPSPIGGLLPVVVGIVEETADILLP